MALRFYFVRPDEQDRVRTGSGPGQAPEAMVDAHV